MPHTTHTDDPGGSQPLALERFAEIVAAYGAASERWPEGERAAAEQLLGESSVARALWESARDLDAILDALPCEQPSAALAARIVAAAPRRTAGAWRRPLLIAAAPLAAAAGVALWLSMRGASTDGEIRSATVDVGQYASPTDVLLEPFGVDVYGSVPGVGCEDSFLGCPDVGGDAPQQSRDDRCRRSYA